MTGPEHLAVIAAGLGAGILTSTVGVASLISFPALIALGIPPVVANASNTIGLLPGALSGSFGYRRELREVSRPTTVAVVVTCAIGAIGGAVLLLALPPGVFAAAAPWLILFTCLVVGVQPWISKWLTSRHGSRNRMTPTITLFTALTGVYGGYFGAGAGVMMMAVLGLGLDLELRVVNGLKTLALLAANLVASIIFVFIADLNVTAAVLLAVGSLVGGYVGSHIGRRLPSGLLRALIVLAGVVAAFFMLT
jgi:uncharacterized membrane protein YfcA